MSAWNAAAARLACAWIALIVLFLPDWHDMADQWWNSSTYNHILVVPVIIGWLVWLRLPELRKLEPTPWWPGLVLLAGAVLLWVLGTFAGFNLLRQTGAIASFPASLLLLLGPRFGAALTFPLAYMTFLLPFGEELVPLLQTVTAKLVVLLMRLSVVPATIDGVFISTPAGLFEVAEACSGVKFLIAMVALGALTANVRFHSWRRRAAFMLLAVVASVLANAVRAWGTILAAQFVGAEAASGIDHIVYGWIFFAVVIAVILGLSWRYFDRALDDPMIDAAAINSSPLLERLARMRLRPSVALTLAAILIVAGKGWAYEANRLSARLPAHIELPEVPGWRRIDYDPSVWWEPRASGADHRLLGRYADAAGNEVDVFVALYESQREGKEAGGFGEGALTPGTAWAWVADGPATPDAKSERLRAAGGVERLADTYYRTGDLLTGSNARLKLANIVDRLALRERPTMLLVLSVERRPGHDPAAGLAAFRCAAGPLGPWMDRIAALR